MGVIYIRIMILLKYISKINSKLQKQKQLVKLSSYMIIIVI